MLRYPTGHLLAADAGQAQVGQDDIDILGKFNPGLGAQTFSRFESAKFVPRGSDIVFSMHYTAVGKPATYVRDRYTKQVGGERVLRHKQDEIFATCCKFLDIEMLILPGGKERTAEEFRTLFERSGFQMTKVVPTKSPLSVVEAIRA